jgi:hypothetical protein
MCSKLLRNNVMHCITQRCLNTHYYLNVKDQLSELLTRQLILTHVTKKRSNNFTLKGTLPETYGVCNTPRSYLEILCTHHQSQKK